MIGAPTAMAGAILWAHEVQREVERRDAEDDALGEAAGEGEPALAAGVGVEALGLAAVEAAGLLGGEPEDGDGAADLAAGPLDRLAVLGGDQLRRSPRCARRAAATTWSRAAARTWAGVAANSSRTAYAAATASSTWASVGHADLCRRAVRPRGR